MKSAEFRLAVRAGSQEVADRVVAEVWAVGALGVEEIARGEGVDLIIYLDQSCEVAIRGSLEAFSGEGVVVGESEAIGDLDWSEAWKEGLEAIVISHRLVVRPSFVEHTPAPGQREVVVDPGRAFGTGGHESTRLILEWVDVLAEDPSPPARVLDVGTGSAVLALAALKLGASSALGFDLDLDAIREARQVSELNGMSERLGLFAGPIASLGAGGFDLVLVNLLRSEMIPIASDIERMLAPGGRLVLSGLLESDRPEVLEVFGKLGLESFAERSLLDGSGALWISPLLGFKD
jgi:ribosomal protein L11 methyltransferase